MFTIIGTMSGTSCDGIDVALLKTNGKDYVKCLGGQTYHYDIKFISYLKSLLLQDSNIALLHLERDITLLHVEAIQKLMKTYGLVSSDIDFIGFHGQTVIHMPEQLISQQIGNPHLLAARTGINIVSDFRRKDIAFGGNGAPLVPIFHAVLANIFTQPLIFLNIGGVANITYIANNEIIAYDTGPGTAMLDDLCNQRLGIGYDDNGAITQSGIVHYGVIQQALQDEFFDKKWPKSLDRNYFNTKIDVSHLCTADAAATLAMFTVITIQQAILLLAKHYTQIIVCGGGRHNNTIISNLQRLLPEPVHLIDQYNIDGDLVEAYAFAYLAARVHLNLPTSFPSTTNVLNSVAGGSITYK